MKTISNPYSRFYKQLVEAIFTQTLTPKYEDSAFIDQYKGPSLVFTG